MQQLCADGKERKLKEKNAAAELKENLIVFYSIAFVITLHTPYFVFFCLMNWGGGTGIGEGRIRRTLAMSISISQMKI